LRPNKEVAREQGAGRAHLAGGAIEVDSRKSTWVGSKEKFFSEIATGQEIAASPSGKTTDIERAAARPNDIAARLEYIDDD
jgi:hypothetical protein